MIPALAMTWPDYRRGEVQVRGKRVRLMPQCVEIVAALLMNRGRTLSRGTLIEMIWPNPDAEPDWAERQINVQICRIRKAIGACAVVTEWGRGFRIPHEIELGESA